MLCDELQRKVLLDALKLAGPDQQLPPLVRVKHGTGNSGRKLHYYLNYPALEQKVAYAYGDGSDVLSGKPVKKAQSVALGPWDLATSGGAMSRRSRTCGGAESVFS